MNDPLTSICLSIVIIISVGAYAVIALSCRHPGLNRFRRVMLGQWRAAAVLTTIYLISSLVSLVAFGRASFSGTAMLAVMGIYMFSLVSLGLGLSPGLPGFEPFRVRYGAKGIRSIVYGTLFLVIVSGVINMFIALGLIVLGVRGPSQSVSSFQRLFPSGDIFHFSCRRRHR